MNQAIDRNF